MAQHRGPLEGLDEEQRVAVCAPRGPVCVLAGAGTGKTRTITRRIAALVHAGHVAPGQVLAVTFTARAAGELRTRLRARLQELTSPEATKTYLAHMVLRQVDWSLRFRPATAATRRHLHLARLITTDIDYGPH